MCTAYSCYSQQIAVGSIIDQEPSCPTKVIFRSFLYPQLRDKSVIPSYLITFTKYFGQVCATLAGDTKLISYLNEIIIPKYHLPACFLPLQDFIWTRRQLRNQVVCLNTRQVFNPKTRKMENWSIIGQGCDFFFSLSFLKHVFVIKFSPYLIFFQGLPG